MTPPWYRVLCHEYLGSVQEAFRVEALDRRVIEGLVEVIAEDTVELQGRIRQGVEAPAVEVDHGEGVGVEAFEGGQCRRPHPTRGIEFPTRSSAGRAS